MMQIEPLFRGSSSIESLIVSHHSRFTCEYNKEDVDHDDDADRAERGDGDGCTPEGRTESSLLTTYWSESTLSS